MILRKSKYGFGAFQLLVFKIYYLGFAVQVFPYPVSDPENCPRWNYHILHNLFLFSMVHWVHFEINGGLRHASALCLLKLI